MGQRIKKLPQHRKQNKVAKIHLAFIEEKLLVIKHI